MIEVQRVPVYVTTGPGMTERIVRATSGTWVEAYTTAAYQAPILDMTSDRRTRVSQSLEQEHCRVLSNPALIPPIPSKVWLDMCILCRQVTTVEGNLCFGLDHWASKLEPGGCARHNDTGESVEVGLRLSTSRGGL